MSSLDVVSRFFPIKLQQIHISSVAGHFHIHHFSNCCRHKCNRSFFGNVWIKFLAGFCNLAQLTPHRTIQKVIREFSRVFGATASEAVEAVALAMYVWTTMAGISNFCPKSMRIFCLLSQWRILCLRQYNITHGLCFFYPLLGRVFI